MASQFETVLVKPAYKATNWTEEQIQDFMRCADPETGPQYFLDNYFYIQHPTRGKMVYHPFDFQKRLIDTYHNFRFSVSLMPRQTGKTTSAAGYLLWYAMFVPVGTPQAIVDALYNAVVKVLAQPSTKEKLIAQGAEAVGSTPAQLGAIVKAELAKWSKVTRESSIKAE